MVQERTMKLMLVGAFLIAIVAIASSIYIYSTLTDQIGAANERINVLTNVLEKNYGLDLATIMGAIQEGQVTIYGSYTLSAMRQICDRFQAKFPFVKVNLVRDTGYTIREKFMSEYKSDVRICDVFHNIIVGNAQGDVDAGMVLNFTPSTAAQHANYSIPGYAYPIYIAMAGIPVVNTDLVSDADAKLLMTYDGLTNPKWKDSCAVVYIGGGVTHYETNYYWMVANSSYYGDAFLQKIAALNPKIFTSATVLMQQLAAGEFKVALWVYEEITHQYLSTGAHIKWYYPSPTPIMPGYYTISSKASHPNAAKLWLEWALSIEGQKAFMEIGGYSPSMQGLGDTRAGALTSWFVGPKSFYYPSDIPAFNASTQSVMDRWSTIFNYHPS